MKNRYLEKIAESTPTSDAVLGGAMGVGGEFLSRKYAPHFAVGHGNKGMAAAGVIGSGVQMAVGKVQRHFQEKKAGDDGKNDLSNATKINLGLVGVLKSNNRAGELKELKEQGAELSNLQKLAAFGVFAKDSIGDIISRTPAGSWKDYTRLVGANNSLDTAYYRAFRRNHMHFPESVPERGYYEAQAKRLSESKLVESAIPGALSRVNTAGVHFGLERPRDVPHLTHFDLRGQI